MEIKTHKENNITTVCLIGRLDTPTAQEIAPKMTALLDEKGGTIVLDCKDLSYICSSGLRIFLSIRKDANEKGGKMIVQNINDDIRNVFMMTGFMNLFEVQESH